MKRMQRLASTFSLLGWLSAPVLAQPTAPSSTSITPVPQTGAAAGAVTGIGRLDARAHRLQPGDQLTVDLLSLPDTPRQFDIRADGTFYHPIAGEVKAAGLTLGDVEKILRKRLAKELRDPRFRLSLQSVARIQVAVLGETKTQGKFDVAPGTSLLDLLAQVGGLSDKADRSQVTLLRDTQRIAVDLSPQHQIEAAAMTLQNGDVLYVNAGKQVAVNGEVYNVGVYAVSNSSPTQLQDAIRAAGGAKENAAVNRVLLRRPTLRDPIIVNLLEPASVANATLQDGDSISLQPRAVVVLGAISKPGQLPISGPITLVDVIAQSGVQDGELEHVVVVRAADVRQGNPKPENYNLTDFFAAKPEDAKPTPPATVDDGDMVYVPHKGQGGGLLGGGGLLNLLLFARSLFAF